MKEKTDLGYSVGDRVSHIKFGEGTVLSIDEGGKDYEVTVGMGESPVWPRGSGD